MEKVVKSKVCVKEAKKTKTMKKEMAGEIPIEEKIEELAGPERND